MRAIARPGRIHEFLRMALMVFLCSIFSPASAAKGADEGPDDLLDRLEWRGVIALPGDVRISLYDKEGEVSFWIRVGETQSGIHVTAYVPEDQLITLRHGDSQRTLSMSGGSEFASEDGEAQREPLFIVGDSPFDDEVQARLSALWGQVVEESSDLAEIDRAFRSLNGQIIQMIARIDHQQSKVDEIAEANPEREERELVVNEQALRYLNARMNRMVDEYRDLTESALEELRKLPEIERPAREELEVGLRSGFLLGSDRLPE